MGKASNSGLASEGGRIVKAIGGVQSIHRAIAILQSVAHAREGIGLAELSKEVGLHTSTTFHIAKTMVMLGLMRQEQQGKRYRVGPRLFSLASGALDELELLDYAAPFLASLAEQTGENSHIAVSSGKEVVIIGKCDGAASIRIAERIGSVRPSHATAIGKVLMSALACDEIDKLLANMSLTPITPKTIVDPDQLKAAICEAGAQGISFDDGEFDPDVRCLAAPVFDFRSCIIAAIGISAPVWRLGLGRVGDISAQVKKAAGNLSAQLGYDESAPSRKSAG
jgi:DNA-binding IclR family transcriptional regulator